MSFLRQRLAAGLLVVGTCVPCAVVRAQTDWFNTDAGRPIRVEDAYAIERRAIELQLAPLRLERARGGSYQWGVEPEFAVGLLPRTQVEIGFPMVHREGGRHRTSALAGIDVAALYTFNAETRLPAFAIAGDLLLPAGGFGPASAMPSVKAIATKTFPGIRFHLNAQWTFAEDPSGAATGRALAEGSRWMTGLAIDHSIPLSALLLTAELVTSQPLARTAPRRLDAAGGIRYQWSPRVAFDAGGGYRLAGDEPGWYLTTGAAVAIGLPWLPRR